MTMRNWIAGMVLAAFVGAAFAQTAKCGGTVEQNKDGAHASGACSGDKASCGGKVPCSPTGECCPANEAFAAMPTIKYRVGTETVDCPTKAGELAKGDKGAIKFVVADKEYANETEAKKSYATVLDSYLVDITTMKYAVGKECVACPMTAESMAKKDGQPVKYRLATFEFADKAKAEKAAGTAKEAAEKVAMKWAVGDKSFCCDKMAGEAAQKEGKQVEYYVGEKKLQCPVEASVELELAKIDAAVRSLMESYKG